MQVRDKVGKSRNTVFFQWFVAPEGRKVGSLKRRVRSHLGRWEMKDCTPLWREDARSTFASEKAKSTSNSEHFWKLRRRKSARRCGAKQILKSKKVLKTIKYWRVQSTFASWDVEKCTPLWREDARSTSKSKCTKQKHTTFRALLEVEMFKKCTPLWREALFQNTIYKTFQPRSTFGSSDVEKVHAVAARSAFRSRNAKSTTCSRHFWRLKRRFVWQAQGICALPTVSKTWRFCSISKTMASVGHLRRICKDGFRAAGAVQETCSLEMSRFEQVQHFVWPGFTFSWQAQYFKQMEWTNRNAHWHEAISSALNFPVLKEVSQNCFVFDVVNCQFEKVRKSRRIASILTLWSSKNEDVSQNCCASDVVRFKNWGSLAE